MTAASRRGELLHALFERLPPLPPGDRVVAGLRWLERAAGAEDDVARRELVAEVCRVVGDPAHGRLFDPSGLAEAPIAAVLPDGLVVAGTVDRLIVTESKVLLIDYKTGRRVPAQAGEAPVSHLRQMAAYAAALAVIFPERTVEAALLYTAGPRLLLLPPALLAAHKPGLTPRE